MHEFKSENVNSQNSRNMRNVAWYFLGLAILVLIACFAETGASAPRMANPAVTGAPRPVPIWMSGIDWVATSQIGTLVMIIASLIACARVWSRRPGHPTVLMIIAATAIVWQDPLMNWSVFAVYNPELWHFPIDWPWISLTPAVEPFFVIAYAAFFVGPYFPALWILRKFQANSATDTFVWQHPLVSLAGLTFVCGFVIDAFLEIFCVSNQIYIYSQVVPFGSIFTGQYNQFPLLWQSSLITLVMIPTALLLYRDDTGRTQAEKLAQRFSLFKTRPALASFIIMFGILNIAYFLYGSAFWFMKVGHFATSVACPWPYPEIKVYDPQGYYENAGQPGPYFEGKLSGFASGQPDGHNVEHIKQGSNAFCK